MVLSFGGIFIEMVKEMLTLFMLAALLLLVINGVWLLYHIMYCYVSIIYYIQSHLHGIQGIYLSWFDINSLENQTHEFGVASAILY